MQAQKGRGVFVRAAGARDGKTAVRRETAVGFALFGDYSEYEPQSQMVLHGAMSVLQERGYNVLYRIFRNDDDLAAMLPAYLSSVSRLIFSRDVTPDVAAIIRAAGVDAVFLDYRAPGQVDLGFSTVRCEAEPSAHLAAQQLLMHGHRGLGLFTVKPDGHEYVACCVEGVARACREYGCPPPRVLHATDRPAERRAAEDLADADGVTGVVALDDNPACRLIRDLTELGAAVPATNRWCRSAACPAST